MTVTPLPRPARVAPAIAAVALLLAGAAAITTTRTSVASAVAHAAQLPDTFACVGARWRDPGATVSVGAIRWDAWFAGNGYERALDDPGWRNRIPFYGLILTPNLVRVRSDSQAVMDQEIAYAAAAGLTYWAFDYYHPRAFESADSFNYGLRLYLSSACRTEINFGLLLQGGWLGPAEEWPATAAMFAGLFQQPTYQTMEGRPLVYILDTASMQHRFGSWAGARAAIDVLRAASVESGLPSPYIVGLGSPRETAAQVALLGLDAIGGYTAPGSGQPRQYPYSALRHANETFWREAEATGSKVVPPVNTGWDPRPRLTGRDHTSTGGHSVHAPNGLWYQTPTPAEFGAHFRKAVEWTQGRRSAEARTILLYAWNEHDEGGWLTPTLAEGQARLDAVEQVLRDLTPLHVTPPHGHQGQYH